MQKYRNPFVYKENEREPLQALLLHSVFLLFLDHYF